MFEWLKGVSGVMIGGLLVIVSNFGFDFVQDRQTRQSLISAFIGDIVARQTIEAQRLETWEDDLDLLITVDALRKPEGRPWLMPEEPKGYIIFEANAGKLGILESPLPEKIANFYLISERLRAEIRLLGGEKILAANTRERDRAVKEHRQTRRHWEAAATDLLTALRNAQ